MKLYQCDMCGRIDSKADFVRKVSIPLPEEPLVDMYPCKAFDMCVECASKVIQFIEETRKKEGAE